VVDGRRPLPPIMSDRSDPKVAHVDRFPPNKCNFFTGLRFEVELSSRGLSAIADPDLLVKKNKTLS